ncbi:MAG: hypothetical protein EZS28_002711 [Streblomastix strix]|uniref:Uncharacterized protein n=1 Tax=Streblomastix strix TaxID=222440 RepID=A0A5J4X5H0_9EUKA|nr:MAG: hypothetical protein EZS28_002711 [Streblomastix strix]
MSEILDLKALKREAREEFEAEKGASGSGAGGGGLKEIDGMDDDNDYYESQRLYKKELPTVIAQQYKGNQIGNKIAQALGFAMQCYCEIQVKR